MGTKHRALLAVLVVIVLGGFAWLFALSHEPSQPVYEGKRLDFWIDQYYRNADMTPADAAMESAAGQAASAIRAIGTNAFPMLLGWAGIRDSALKLRLRRLIVDTHWRYLTRFRLKISPDQYHYRAILAFQFFKSDGAPAVPALVHLLGDPDDEVRLTAMECLQLIGPPAKPAVPVLVACLKDTNLIVRQFAADTLRAIHSEPEIVVPALIELLNQTNRTAAIPGVAPGTSDVSAAAIYALGKFGPEARESVPALIKSLADDHQEVRQAATNALKQIDPEAAAKAGVK